MARNGSGTYTVPNSFTSGTAITASDHNENWSDAASEITNSVAADGQTTMTGALKASNGTESAPAYTFGSDTNSGFWRIGADNIGVGVAGSKVIDIGASAITITPPTTFSGAVTFSTGLGASSIANDAITYAKIQNVSATNKLLGRVTSGAGDVEEIGLGTGVEFSGGNLVATAQLPRGYIDGCILSNGTDASNDIDISAGVCRDSTNAVDITVPALSGKQLDANWAAGGSAGMRNSAAGITDTTYHLYAVRTAASATGDIYAHTSTTVATVLTALQAESGGADYVYARRIGSIIRASSAILGFSQFGDEYLLTTPVLSSNTAPTTTASLVALSVPAGVKVRAEFNVYISRASSSARLYVSSPDTTDAAASTSAAPGVNIADADSGNTSQAAGQFRIRTNTSGEVRVRTDANLSAAIIVTTGWVDARGKDS